MRSEVWERHFTKFLGCASGSGIARRQLSVECLGLSMYVSLCHAELILEWSIFARSVLDSDDLLFFRDPTGCSVADQNLT